MAKSSNSKIKILYLMKILSESTDEEHGLTLSEISEALGNCGIDAERKALYDDIETLRVFGMDIEKRKGKSVTYHVTNRNFELPELKLLVDAVQASKFITHKKSEELIKKLEGLTSRYQAQQLQRQVYVSNRIKTMNESIYYSVDSIHDAINRNCMISFNYFEWTSDKLKQLRHDGELYEVSPWALCWYDENYYMIAYDSKSESIKHYRVDKMLSIKVTDKKRCGGEHFADFDMGLYSKKTFGMYGGEEATVVLECSNRLAGVIIDRFGRDTFFRKTDFDRFEVRVKVAVSHIFLTWLMNFGSDITILSPMWVKEKYITVAKQAIEHYKV